ncbi:Murein DD-endopeptidase MepH [Fundidesulfovibrio magnetotacticus]|uniref:Murein DD-endopeptidase MepH n=1 Tax=Fundidesulfovibrio magnetotacticus TaxID=2730080 RepID=A0A6V8LY55_9BACT|nr:C40 family peptidase [Fundidesulfovibrio magnetotacticus]GFK95760.1 Murein DD-endopeptidase MepH [Fundidesulfovibrio magnetotacticus]
MTTGAKWTLAVLALAALAFASLGAGMAGRTSQAGPVRQDAARDAMFYLAALRGEALGLRGPGDPFHSRLTRAAFSQAGRGYVYGGAGPSGFDCSGFTSWSYAQAGHALPRTSGEQFRQGRAVDPKALRQGDLVFFGREGRVDHVGIYLADGRFIHSSRPAGGVAVSSLADPYWTRTYAGARRPDAGGAP